MQVISSTPHKKLSSCCLTKSAKTLPDKPNRSIMRELPQFLTLTKPLAFSQIFIHFMEDNASYLRFITDKKYKIVKTTK